MNIDFTDVVKALKEIDYKGYFTLEANTFFSQNRGDDLNGPLANINLDIKRDAVALMYKISKYIL